MSTVSSVGGYGQELLQMLQQMKLSSADSSTASGKSQEVTSRLAEGLSGNRAQKFEEQLSAFAEEAGLDEESIAALQEDVRSAISAALEESDGSTDHRELVKNAVSSTLDSYGLDAQAFDEEMKANAPPPPSGGMPGGMGVSGLTGTTEEETDSTSAMSQFLSLLNGSSDSSGLLANLSLLDSMA